MNIAFFICYCQYFTLLSRCALLTARAIVTIGLDRALEVIVGFVPLEVKFLQFDLEAAARSALLKPLEWLNDVATEVPEEPTKTQRIEAQIAEKVKEIQELAAKRELPSEFSIPLCIGDVRHTGFLFGFGHLTLSLKRKRHRFILLHAHKELGEDGEPSGEEYYLLFIAASPPPDPAHPWKPAQVNIKDGSLMMVWEQPNGGSLEDRKLEDVVRKLLPGVVNVWAPYYR